MALSVPFAVQLVLLITVFVSQGAAFQFQFTQQDYESRSHKALLQGIRKFQIEKSDLLSELLNSEHQTEGHITNLQKSCSCSGYTCSCCMRVKIDKIELNSNVCLKLSYLPNEYGIQIQVTVDGKVVYQHKISAKNPPAVCFGVPGLKKMASLCIRFYNLEIAGKQLSGCIELQAKLYKVLVEKVQLGCFKIPPQIEDSRAEDSLEGHGNEYEMDTGDLPLELLSDAVAIGTIEDLKGCSCVGYSCGCCMRIRLDKIHLNDNVCLNVSYLPSEIGVEMELTVNGVVIFKKKVSAKNPPPVCAGVPGLKSFARLCLHFYNISISGQHLSGCLDIEARLFKVLVEKIHIGCFRIPPRAQDASSSVSLVDNSETFHLGKSLESVVTARNLEESILETIQKHGNCSCQKSTCNCCAHAKNDKIHLDSQLCIKVTYLDGESAIQAEFTIDGKSIFNKKVAVATPNPICVPLKNPYKICVHFKNFKTSGKSLKGCLKLTFKISTQIVGMCQLGCFNISSSINDISLERSLENKQTDLISKTVPVMSLKLPITKLSKESILSSKNCSCQQDACQCCNRVKVDNIHLDSYVCLRGIFLPQERGIQVLITLDGKLIFKEKVSVENPPPMCVKMKESAKVCLLFTKQKISEQQISGCVELLVKVSHMTVDKFQLGCFKFPLKSEKLSIMNDSMMNAHKQP